MKKDEVSESSIQECLKSLGLSLLCDWDVLIFLHRHQASLASAEHIAHLLGYSNKLVGDALDRLEAQQLVRRSRYSGGVRFYECIAAAPGLAPESSFRSLATLAETRTGRLLIVKHLRQNTYFRVAARGQTK